MRFPSGAHSLRSELRPVQNPLHWERPRNLAQCLVGGKGSRQMGGFFLVCPAVPGMVVLKLQRAYEWPQVLLTRQGKPPPRPLPGV